MTKTQNIPTLDRPMQVDDIVVYLIDGETLFDVVALDDLYDEFVYVRRHASEAPAQWVAKDRFAVVDD